MAQVIKSVIVNWDWDGDTDAIRGFNVALTPQGGDPRDRTIAYALTGTANYSHRFDNVPLDNQVNYTGWVQALYEGDDSDWVNTNGVVYPDDGDNTIQRSIDIDERGLDESGNFTGSISGLAAEIARKYAEKGWETSGITGININDWSQRLDLSSLPSGITRSFEVSIERHNNRVYVRNKGSAENPGGSAVTFELEVNGAVCLGYDGSVGGTGLSETEIPADKGSNIDFENDPYGLYGPNGAIIRVNATGAGTDQGFLLFDNITESTVFRLRIVSVSDEDNFALGLGGRFVAFNTRMPFEAHFSPVDSQDLDALLLANGPAEAGATTNRVFRSNGAPTEPDGGFKDGDLWFDINDKILYEWNAATLEWDNIGNDFRDTSELTDGAALGNTALWDLITGAGKPESYADVTGTSDAHTQLVAQVDAVEQSSGENQTAIAGLSDRADTLESDAQALADRATAVEGRADNLETEAQALSGRADSLESESAAQAQEISDQAADLQQKAQDILANADNIAAIDVRVSDAESGVDANASAVNGLDVRVGQTESGVSANSSEISALESRVTDTESGGSANASAIQAIDTRVTTAEGEITSQSSDITSLENRVDDTETGVSGNSSAISGLDSRVTSAEGTITSQSSEITSLQAGQSVIRNADSLTGNAYFDEGFNGNQPTGWAAWAGGGQGPSFDALTGEKSVAFSRTPDQQAGINQEIHDVAEGLSGIEVEVVMKVVSGDANASGLIIDWHLVGGGASRTSTRFGDYADTLKTGVWQTMRIAIERPSQAEEYSHMNFFLMGQYGPLGTRYDVDVIFDRCVVRPLGADHAQVTGNSSAISGLDSRVTSAEGTITSHSSEITSLETRVGDNETGVSGNSSAISGLDSRVTDTEGQISSVASDVTALETRVSDNETGNSANSDAISALDSRVTTNEGDITSQASQITALGSEIDDAQAGVSGNATAISGLDTRVTSAEGEISSSASDISALGARVDDTESGVSGNSSAISGLDSRVTSAEGTITSHASDITSLQNEVDDAQTGISGNSSAISGLDSRVTSAEGTITSQSSEITSLQASQQTMRQADSLLFNSYFDEGWGTGSPSGWTKYQKGASEDTGDWLTGGAAARCTLTASEEGGIRYSSDNDYVDGLKGVDVELAFKLLSGDAGAAGMLVGWKVAGGNYENRQYRIEDYADPALVGVWQTIKFAAPRPSESTSYEGFQFYALGSWNGFGVGRDVDILFDRCVVRPAGASLAAQGNASAISALDSRVTTAEGGITSNSSSITSLENRVTDTESGVSGNSSAISGLDSRVTTAEGEITSQSSDITSLENRVDDTESGVSGNSSAISGLDSRVTSAEGTITSQSSDITTLQSDVDDAQAGVSGNSSAISGLDSRVTSAEGSIASNSSSITSLENRVDDAETGVSGNSSAISGLNSRVTSAEGTITSQSSDITSLENRVDDTETGVSGNSSAISGIDSRVTANEDGITSISSDVTELEAYAESLYQRDTLNNNGDFAGWQGSHPDGWTAWVDCPPPTKVTTGALTGGNVVEYANEADESMGMYFGGFAFGEADGTPAAEVEVTFKLVSGGLGAAGVLLDWVFEDGNQERHWVAFEDHFPDAVVDEWMTIKTTVPRETSTRAERMRMWLLTSWSGPQANGAPLEAKVVQVDRILVRHASEEAVQAKGNASAISALDSRVTTAEGGITSNSSSITSLENRVDDTESGVSGNSSAISGLDSRVVATENSVASNASDITALDARVVDTETGLANNAGAINLLDTRVTDTEGEVSAQATALTELSTSVDGNTATISENATSIDGLELQYTVKLDNNGAISGFGLASEPSDGSGGSTSTFTITADKFEIADPSDTTEQSAPFQWTAGELKLKGDVYVDGAITAEKIAVGGIPDQLVVNGGAENGTTEGWYLTQGSDVGITVVPAVAGANGDSSFFINGKDTAYGCKAFPVVPGEKYYFRAGVVSASGTSFPNGQYLRIQYTGAKPTGQTIGAHAGQTPRDGYKDIRSNAEVPAVYTTYDYVWTVPAGVNWANLAIFNWSSGDPDGVYFDDVMVQRQLTGELIVNGTLTADHIQANSITLAEVASDIEGLGDTASWGQVTGAGRPADNADVTGNNTANDTSNVAGTSAATVRDRAEDPISRANAKSTRLAPGLVQISGSTNLDDWSHPSDTTTINGGQIFTESVTAEKIAADTFKTTNYAENGSGEPTAGAKLDHQGTALKVAADNLQVGPYVFTDAMVRVLQALDGDSTTNLYFYRGNNDVTERGGAPNIYALDIRSIREDTSDKDYEIELEILPINDDDNLDAMRYAELEFYVGTSSGASYAFTEYVQVPDRKYEHSTHSNAANAVRVSHWFESIYSSTGLRSTNTQYFFIKAKLHNAHGASQDLWFAPTNSLGTDWTKSTSAPYSGGSGAGNPPSGGGGSGYCPAPWVQIKLADGTSIAAEDLYDGAKIMGFDEFNEGKAFVNTVRMPMRRWEQRYRIELENALTTEYSCKHRLLVKGAHEGQRHWRAIESISAGDVVITDQGEARVSRVVRASKGPVISFMAEGNGTYIGDGFVSHNIKSATP